MKERDETMLFEPKNKQNSDVKETPTNKKQKKNQENKKDTIYSTKWPPQRE
jgi:hypothetical protein